MPYYYSLANDKKISEMPKFNFKKLDGHAWSFDIAIPCYYLQSSYLIMAGLTYKTHAWPTKSQKYDVLSL